VGGKGQAKLLNAKVLIVGAGGLGAPAAMYLAAAGIGTIGLVDFDEVDLSNLQRQIIHSTKDVGKPKVLSGQETINELNPDVQVVTYQEWVGAGNLMDIIKDRDYDFIIDGTDNFPAKFLINDACVLSGKAFSHAGIIRFQGQTMTYLPGQGPCYRCVFSEPPPPDAVPTCRQAGVIGVMGGIIGTIQATEAIKYILGIGELLHGYLLTYDALKMAFRKVKIPRRPGCQVCGENPVITSLQDYEQAVCDL
jgi:molybdopterin/thiamine biosynthesis adenylyltransferase